MSEIQNEDLICDDLCPAVCLFADIASIFSWFCFVCHHFVNSWGDCLHSRCPEKPIVSWLWCHCSSFFSGLRGSYNSKNFTTSTRFKTDWWIGRASSNSLIWYLHIHRNIYMLDRGVICVYDMLGRHDNTLTSIVCVATESRYKYT